jgi:signal transduction histidine kinase
MTEKKGHFEKGVWKDEPAAAPAAAKDEKQIDARLEAATKSVISAMDELAKATHDLVATEEGKKHIEKTVKETTAQVQKSFDDILAKAKAEMDKAKADVKAEMEKAKQKK